MAKISKVTYICDSCSAEVEKARDLSHFEFADLGRAGRGTWKPREKTQVCDKCKANLLRSLLTFGFDVSQWAEE